MTLTQSSFSRGEYRVGNGGSVVNVSGVSTSDVHNQIVFDRPNPIKIGFSEITTGNPSVSQGPPTSGYGPGSLYFIYPTLSMVSGGFGGLCQIWLCTDTFDTEGNLIWILFYSVNTAQAGTSGGGDSGGSGGGDGGDG